MTTVRVSGASPGRGRMRCPSAVTVGLLVGLLLAPTALLLLEGAPEVVHVPTVSSVTAATPASHADLHSAAQPLTGGVLFQESGLPTSTAWAVSTWEYEVGLASPDTSRGTGTTLTLPASYPSDAADFAVWTLPSSTSGSVWYGSASPEAPIDLSPAPEVNVSFGLLPLSTLNFSVHVLTTGLPPESRWPAAVNGVGYSLSADESRLTAAGGSTFQLNASPVVNANGTAYVPTEFRYQEFWGSSPWTNSTTGVAPFSVSGDVCLVVGYSLEVRVEVGSTPGGSASPGSGYFPLDAPLILTAARNPNFWFAGWSGNGPGAVNSSSASVTVVPLGPLWMEASFSPLLYTLGVSAAGLPVGQGFSVVFNGSVYTAAGSILTLPATGNGTYPFSIPTVYSNSSAATRFSELALSGSIPRGAAGTIVVTGSGNLTVSFATEFSVTVDSVGNGTVDPAPGSYWVAAASELALSAVPSPGSALVAWTGTGSGAYTGPLSATLVTVGGPLAETARFGPAPPPTTYSVTLDESGLPPGTLWYAAVGSTGGSSNASRLVVAGIAPGVYAVTLGTVAIGPGARWAATLNGTPSPNRTVSGNLTLGVTFETFFEVRVVAGPGGSVGPGPNDSWVAAGSVVALAAYPASVAYGFVGWNGTVDSPSPMLTVTAVGPLTETALFAPKGSAPLSPLVEGAVLAAAVAIPLVAGVLLVWAVGRVRRRAPSPGVPRDAGRGPRG